MENSKVEKKVLIITYYWPPSGGIGVLRCLKIAKYLRDYGWEPVIFTAKNPHYPSIDHSNDRDIPKDVEIIKGNIVEPYTLYKFFTGQKKDANVNNVLYVKETKVSFTHKLSIWIRSNFFIPDARAIWIKPSVKLLETYLKGNKIDAIFTDGPPHSNTRIATLLSQKTGIPWLADFQDPWTQVDYYKQLILTKWGRKKHERLEQEAFKTAKKTTIVSPSWKKDLESIGAHNVAVIPWGFDPKDFRNINVAIDEKFTITHVGIMGADRNTKTLFKVILDLSKEIKEFGRHIELKLIGQVDVVVKETIKEIGIQDKVNLVGYVDRVEALNMTCSSNLLLLLLNKQSNAKGRIPGKLFEYMAAKRPILTFGPLDSDVAQIITESNSGTTLEYNDYEAIKDYILLLYNKFINGTLYKPVESDIEKYSIQKLTGRIAGYLDEISK